MSGSGSGKKKGKPGSGEGRTVRKRDIKEGGRNRGTSWGQRKKSDGGSSQSGPLTEGE